MHRLKWFAIMILLMLFLDLDFTVLIFGGRRESLMALAVLLIAVIIAIIIICRRF